MIDFKIVLAVMLASVIGGCVQYDQFNITEKYKP